jgi:hypothetical protein
MSFDMGGSTETGKSTQMPKAPPWVEDPTRQLTQAIMALGKRPSSSYVTPASSLQNAAFGMGNMIAGRYGITPQGGTLQAAQGYSQPGQMQSGPTGSGGGLFESLGTSGLPDYAAYLQQNPDVASWASTAVRQPHFTKGAGSTAADYDGDGSISSMEMARHHYETYGQAEGRSVPGVQSGGGASVGRPGNINGLVDVGGGRMMQGGDGQPMVQAGSGAPQTGSTPGNPLDNYSQAGMMALLAGGAGPNTATSARVGDVRDVSAASMGSESLLRNLDKYMSPYTNDVVDTTLAGFDVNAERLRAQQAAAGAGRGAFGGSRYAIGQAVTEGELARERAASEAGLRDRAFTTGAGLSGQDADRRQQAGAMNAQMAQQAALANQQSELARILAQAGYDQQTGMFNAGQADSALERQLSASGLLTQIGATQQGQERADMEMLAGLGGQQRQIQQSYDQADIQSLSAITQLLSQLGLSNYIGQSGTGTVNVKNTGNALGNFLDSASTAAGKLMFA